MTEYRRARVTGATWFFTVCLAERRGNNLLVDQVDRLRKAFSVVQRNHPFKIEAWCCWTTYIVCGDCHPEIRILVFVGG